MDRESGRVERHYGRGGILGSILAALKASHKDMARLAPQDLAPVDEFHLRGREATLQLAQRAALRPGLRVLDVGCGLGGSARHLAAEHGCHVTGVDLTREYIDAARELAERVGLQEQVSFHACSALSLPFPPDAFDLVWTEHAQMNIADKPRFYGEIVRVLSPNDRLVFHDIFQGEAGPPYFPVPWAEEPSLSALAPPDAVRGMLEHLGCACWTGRMSPSPRASGFVPCWTRLRSRAHRPWVFIC